MTNCESLAEMVTRKRKPYTPSKYQLTLKTLVAIKNACKGKKG